MQARLPGQQRSLSRRSSVRSAPVCHSIGDGLRGLSIVDSGSAPHSATRRCEPQSQPAAAVNLTAAGIRVRGAS